jgi:hypothetical protein
MSDDPIDLRSVNWSQGMFLTPDHFNRQERYFDSALLWMLHYGSPAAGLVGGGPRVTSSEYGAASFDPVVDVEESGDELKVAVTQCRGVTGAGGIVDVVPARPLKATFSKRDLEGVLQVGVHVVARPHDKEPDEGVNDPINPVLQTGKRSRYRISLDPAADEAPWSLLLIRLRRSESRLRFERVAGFIPRCASMSAHSELMHAYRRVTERIITIADHYSALHRAIVDFIGLAKTRGLNIDQDNETLGFVSRMVVILEDCAYSTLDPLQSPQQFFRETTQLIRSSALFLSLSPPTRAYFSLLGEIGATEFVAMLEQEGAALEMARQTALADDLGAEAEKILSALDRLDRLEQALEGKYMDYRVSPSLESIDVVFDGTSGEAVLYQTVARPARPQAYGQQLTFVFAPLRLEARDQYRIILVGDRQARFADGDTVSAELRINTGGGYDRPPDFHKASWEVQGQRNFAVDFSAPADVVNISDLRVSVRSVQPIKMAILYVRKRLIPSAFKESVSPRVPFDRPVQRTPVGRESVPSDQQDPRSDRPVPPVRKSRIID